MNGPVPGNIANLCCLRSIILLISIHTIVQWLWEFAHTISTMIPQISWILWASDMVQHSYITRVYQAFVLMLIINALRLNNAYASVNYASIDSDNDLSPVRHQVIIWTNTGTLLITPMVKKSKWNLSQIINIFHQENEFENVVCETDILSRSQWLTHFHLYS